MKRFKTFLAALMSLTLAMPSTFTGVVAAEETKTYAPGVTVEANANKEQDADYQVTFVYESDKDIEKVTVAGNFQWHLESERDQYKPNNSNDDMQQFRAEDYKDGMYNSSGLHGQEAYELEETSEGHYQVTIPVPGNLYFYDYTITYADGSKQTIKDPANMPVANPANGHDSGHSLVYVGNGDNCTKGQEYIYPRTDGQTGKREYLSYTASDGSTQPLEVYTPYGYDATKEYPTLYVSHGGGGQEAEWMEIGAAANIMDNLIAAGEMAPVVMVTMDNTYFGFNAGKNIINNIIPTIEAKYAVSKDPDDRAFCGLSSGSMQTNELAREYPNEFGYFGAFSGGNRDLDPTHYDQKALQNTGYYLSAGCIDMAYNNTMGISSIDYMKLLDQLEVDYDFELLSGAHDWGVWRESLTRFAKNHLWDVDTSSSLPAGPTTVKADNKAGYNTTFVYETTDKNVASVAVTGSFVFLYFDDCKDYQAMADNSSIPTYSVYDYEPGMFSTNTSTQSDVTNSYEMTKTAKGRYEITLPLPASMYYYDYVVTYTDGTTKTVKDPANMPVANPATGSDAGHSLLRVGTAEGTEEGQEYVYARTDGQTGSYDYYPYKDVNGDTRYIAVYLPYGYDEAKTYKTVYISHGGGGNEAEWMTIGAVPEIFDNLIAEGLVEPTVVVAMDNNVYGWNYDVVLPNVLNNIIPFVEKNFSVSKEANDRAFCGLSMGSMTTNMMSKQYPNEFGYFGAFSGGIQGIDDQYDVEAMNNSVIWLSAGCIDMAYNNKMGIATTTLMELYDQLGINYSFDLYTGAHDWGFWRHAISTFAKDYLWQNESTATLGVTVAENTNYPETDAKWQATFAVDADELKLSQSPDKIASISLNGNFQFYTEEEIKAYKNGEKIKSYSPYEYKEGMFTTGYNVGENAVDLVMERHLGNVFTIELPLPGSEYYYGYNVTYVDGSTETVNYDPNNMPVANEANGHDSGWSLVWVGDASACLPHQEYTFPRADQLGTSEFIPYTAVDGSTQYLNVYVPYNYDPNKEYKTIYISHGGGGNEAEWFQIGAGKNIMDNLIAEGEVAESLLVAMDNTYFGWDMDAIRENLMKNIIPTIEAKWSVGKTNEDRAFCGLSMGGGVATRVYETLAGEFKYIGIWSGTYPDIDTPNIPNKNYPTLMLGCGVFDFAQPGFPLLKDNFDNAGVEYDYYEVGGSHCWGTWRSLLTIFVKDIVWDAPQTETPEQGGTTGGNTTGGTTTNPTTPNVGIYNNAAYVAVASIALAGAAYVALKKKED